MCIVGAGISGITTAYLLAKRGKSVIVLDDGAVGGGQTEGTTAHISNALDDRYYEIERLHGFEGAKLAAGSHTAAIDRIESIIGEEQIDCDFVGGRLSFSPARRANRLAGLELAAAHRAGLGGVDRLRVHPINTSTRGLAWFFPANRSSIRSSIWTRSLRPSSVPGPHLHRNACRGRQGRQSGTNQDLERPDRHRRCRRGGDEFADQRPRCDPHQTGRLHELRHRWRPIRTRRAPRHAAYWDTLDPYHYVRIQPLPPGAGMTEAIASEGPDVLIVGGEDHKTGQAPPHFDPYARLEARVRATIPDD